MRFTGRFGRRWGRKKITKAIIIAVVGGIAFLSLASVAMLGWAAKDLPNPHKIIDRSVALSTKIYDRTGETLLYDIHGNQKRTLVELKDIPQHLINATLIAEDKNFYEHKGLSITGIIRSAIRNVLTGSRVGGSTLTQQLVKNAILSPEKTYTRKLKEAILSYQIEKAFSKDEILQLYFNEIPYGSTAYGAEAAAQTYFGKSVKTIGLAEAAILAALPKAPTFYSPYGSNIEELFGRQQFILNGMAEAGYITQEDADRAAAEKVTFKEHTENITAPHFVMYVRDYLTQKYGELAVEQGGLQVVTSLDTYKQQIAEETVTELAERNLTWDAHNAALVAIDPKTGQILAMVGSKDYFDDEIDGQVNVTARPRQPGSSFKPIVYAAAFRKGYTPETVLYDVVTPFLNYDGRDYTPKNYDLRERGPVTIRQALAGSLNIPAVKTIYLTGVDQVLDVAGALGYTTLTDRSRFGLSLVLGGGEVKLVEHTNAFAVFAREGEWHPIVSVLKVTDKDGNVLEEYELNEHKVLETQVARQINSILSDNNARAFIFGAKNYLTLGDRPVAAKTGTTNDYHDAWTIGYTPSLAAGVWVGNSNNDAMKRGADGSVVAAPIWQRFMSRVLGDTPMETFKEPEPTTTDKPALNGSLADGVTVKIDRASGKLATTLTPDSFVEERTYQQAHSILYYIDKDDPQGSSPPNRSGEQYTRWETAVQRWATENNIVNQDPPTEFDDLHTIANRPSISITSPGRGRSVTSRSFQASVSVSAPRGVNRVEYYLNSNLIGTATDAPFSLSTFIDDPTISNGSGTLKAIAYDDVDNSRADEINIILDLPNASPPLTWLNPTAGATLGSDNFPITLSADLTNPSAVESVSLFAWNGQDVVYINTIRQFPNGRLTATWSQPPAPGQYELYGDITSPQGARYESERISITIK